MNIMVIKGTPRKIAAEIDALARETQPQCGTKRTPEERADAFLGAYAREQVIRAYGEAELARIDAVAAGIMSGQRQRMRRVERWRGDHVAR